MDAIGRFKYFRRKLREKIGAGPILLEADRHLSHAASISQILEVSRHEMMLGRQLDGAALAKLREELPIALMRATIAQTAHQRKTG